MSRVTRRGLLGAGGASALGASFVGNLASAEAAVSKREDGDKPKNVLLIVTSNTRADFIGAYDGSDDLAKTPNLDKLAGESLRFEHAVAESMPTVPARRALLTGMRSFPFRDWRPTDGLDRVPGWNPIDEGRQPIVTDVMRKAGVTTAYATDNPFLVGPHFRNFRETVDHWEGQLSQASWGRYSRRYDRPASRDEVEPFLAPGLVGGPEEERLAEYVGWNKRHRPSEKDYSAARVVTDGVRLLGELKGKQPFFLGVDLFDPSEPFDPPPRYYESGGGIRPIQPFETPYSLTKDAKVDDDMLDEVRRLYAAELTFVDTWIGRLLRELDRQGLAGDTLVIYTSDHGISLGEHGILGRSPRMPGEEVYRVPLMVRHPDKLRAGDSTDYYAMTHDVPRTALSWLGVRKPGKVSGEDLTEFFDDYEDYADREDDVGPGRRSYFTSMLEDTYLAGNEDWLFVARDQGANRSLFETEEDEDQTEDIIRERPKRERELWNVIIRAAGGTVPQFDENGPTRPKPEESDDPTAGDDEPGTREDSDLQDRKEEVDRQQNQQQGVSSTTNPLLTLACAACGAVFAARSRKLVLEQAQSHFAEAHPAEERPELVSVGDDEPVAHGVLRHDAGLDELQ